MASLVASICHSATGVTAVGGSGRGGRNSFHEDYEVGEKLGSGYTAHVHKALCRRSKEEVAVKIIAKEKQRLVACESYYRDVYKTIPQLTRHHHRTTTSTAGGGGSHLVCIQEMYEDNDHFYLVMERCFGKDLVEFVLAYEPGEIPETICKRIMKQILCAVHTLHTNELLHRDIKLDNVMFRDEGNSEIALIDFDMCMFTNRTDTPRKLTNANEVSVVGTREYMAPECYRGEYSSVSDIWSCGVILYVLLDGHFPFDVHSVQQQHRQGGSNSSGSRHTRKLLKAGYRAEFRNKSQEAADLLKQMLHFNHNVRISNAVEALSHPWFQSIPSPLPTSCDVKNLISSLPFPLLPPSALTLPAPSSALTDSAPSTHVAVCSSSTYSSSPLLLSPPPPQDAPSSSAFSSSSSPSLISVALPPSLPPPSLPLLPSSLYLCSSECSTSTTSPPVCSRGSTSTSSGRFPSTHSSVLSSPLSPFLPSSSSFCPLPPPANATTKTNHSGNDTHLLSPPQGLPPSHVSTSSSFSSASSSTTSFLPPPPSSTMPPRLTSSSTHPQQPQTNNRRTPPPPPPGSTAFSSPTLSADSQAPSPRCTYSGHKRRRRHRKAALPLSQDGLPLSPGEQGTVEPQGHSRELGCNTSSRNNKENGIRNDDSSQSNNSISISATSGNGSQDVVSRGEMSGWRFLFGSKSPTRNSTSTSGSSGRSGSGRATSTGDGCEGGGLFFGCGIAVPTDCNSNCEHDDANTSANTNGGRGSSKLPSDGFVLPSSPFLPFPSHNFRSKKQLFPSSSSSSLSSSPSVNNTVRPSSLLPSLTCSPSAPFLPCSRRRLHHPAPQISNNKCSFLRSSRDSAAPTDDSPSGVSGAASSSSSNGSCDNSTSVGKRREQSDLVGKAKNAECQYITQA
eukprot:GHVS01098228.1.p1 GENE.GHVS01098228.1~~GHVS01098228.1.p1  ORF type:complete len:900 (-),score=235.87 GHVS01098228.1:143-2842(-)